MRLAGVLTLSAVVCVAAACSSDEVTIPVRERYVVPLNGQNERPNAVTTTATGSAVVTMISADSIEWVLYVSGMDSITAGHFHAADANTAGPIIAFVFSGPVTGRGFGGLLSGGIITRSTPFSGVFTFDSLVTRIRAGTTYLNVHTRRFGGGEIRGQVAKGG
jgi:hypothetical protein